ncbi:LytTR family transcriptional regulator DNA-binding domain-containing protein [Sphingobacterium sp. SYP-B4668]|uniref:LytTR family transcriptional regulator DNA-binding domain-containing protein n=1 Tax=Sphingobacterium sp. SYP-B4668 TaxID=2996035 RepID=UPI0022DE1BF1|nr:LytTR family transcriptional regulator DNA-binding domain-containing protein [Sphingobacterium sp. SYP-B4668]
MRPIYLNTSWKGIISLVGGLFLIFAAEEDYPWDIVFDDDFFLNYFGAVLSIFLVLKVQHVTIRRVDRLYPFKRRSRSYFVRRYAVQGLMSALPTFLVAFGFAWILIVLVQGQRIQETSYFKFDIYVVVACLLFLQIILAFIHYAWTKDQFEEVMLVEEYSVVRYRTDSRKGEIRDLPHYKAIIGLLAHAEREGVGDVDGPEGGTMAQEGGEPTLLLLGTSRRHTTYTKLVGKLPWPDIAYLFSAKESTYYVTWNGDSHMTDCSLNFLKNYMDRDAFCKVGRRLIVHRAAVVGVKRTGRGQVCLRLKPAGDVDTHLSREMTRTFKKWYILD